MTDQQRVVTLIALMRRTTQGMVDELVRRVDTAGYPNQASFHYVFENIDAGGTRLTTLAARAGLTHQSMGELVATMERRGYLERVPDPSDGRARLVRLTAAGRALVKTAIQEIRAIEETWQSRWRHAGLDVDLEPIFAQALAMADTLSDAGHRHEKVTSTTPPDRA